jgi:hypothetical protein
MKTTIQSRNTTLALLGLAMGAMFLTTGCLFSTETSAEAKAEIAGVLQGDAVANATLAKGAASVEGAVVTAHEVTAEGAVGPAITQAQTDANGAFVVKVNAHGAKALIVRSVHAGTEWKARVVGGVEAGKRRVCRPMNLESSLEADVWIELQKTPQGRSVHASEVSATVDAEVALSVRPEFRGSDTARARLLVQLARVVEEGSRARAAVTTAVYARVEAAQARAEAEADFEASLNSAGSNGAAVRAARATYVKALIDADVDAGLDAVIQARSREAAYHALINASVREGISDSARAALTRNAAKILAASSDMALQVQFRAAGATEARMEGVAEAGATYQAAIEAAVSPAECDSAANRYRAELQASFDSAFVALSAAIDHIATSMDSMSVALEAGVKSDVGAEAVGEAYAEAHAEARARVLVVLGALVEETKASATADVAAFLAVRSGG